MNKKFLFGMFAASMLMVTSCSNEELGEVQSGNEATVSFTLGVENAAQTRAISDGTGATELHYTVFDNEGNVVQATKVESGVTYPKQIVLTLAKGKTYQVAFWAQNPDCEAYTFDDKMNVTVDYAGLNNDETRDAFCKTTNKFTVTGNASQNVVLRRPFAQLNVGITEEAWTAAVNAGVECEMSKVTFENAATGLNVLTGAVSGETVVNYALNTRPEEKLKANNSEYMYLSMCYLLVNTTGNGTSKANINNVDFTFETVDGNYGVELGAEEGLAEVPVQRNWRTNILLDKFLTGDITFTIDLDPAYYGDDNKYGTLIPKEEEQPEEVVGLSVQWAETNLGAADPQEIGDYYQWGGLTSDPLSKNPVDIAGGKEHSFVWAAYPYYVDKDGTTATYANEMTKYNAEDGKTVLEAMDDIAAKELGDDWRMPTVDEVQELIDECAWNFRTDLNAWEAVCEADGQSIILPISGLRNGTGAAASGYACFWTSTVVSNWIQAYNFESNSSNVSMGTSNRFYGMPIRPVRAKK